MPRVGKKRFAYTPSGRAAAAKFKSKIGKGLTESTKPAAGKAKPNARAMERANSNASFKRTVPAPIVAPATKPAAAAMKSAPGQMKKLAGAKSAKAFAPGQMKKAGAIKPPSGVTSPGMMGKIVDPTKPAKR